MSSIVLDPMIKDMIMEDAKDFMSSETWYADRGKRLFISDPLILSRLTDTSSLVF